MEMDHGGSIPSKSDQLPPESNGSDDEQLDLNATEEDPAMDEQIQRQMEYEAKALEGAQRDALTLKELSRPMLSDAEMQQAFFPFLAWLSQPAVNSCEALVKVRRINSLTQLQPIKLNLRFIFGVLHDQAIVNEVSIDALAKPFVCKSLYEAMVNRQVGSSRIHVLFLLVKKVLVYLSSKESIDKRQFIQPSSIESYFYVQSLCSDHGQKRKQESRNRAVLGVEESRALAQALHPAGQADRRPFEVPARWSEAGPKPAPAAAATTVPQDRSSIGNEKTNGPAKGPTMSKEELQRLAHHCLKLLNSTTRWTQEPIAHQALATERDVVFVSHLVTATLCLGLAPRSQVLKQLQIGSSFIKNEQDGRYWVRILAEMSKNGKPTMFALPVELTPAYDLYLEVIRPRMLERCGSWNLTKVPLRHKYVFSKRNGQAPRAEFSSFTASVTQQVLGRPINAHAFRAAVITTYYQAGASQSEMDTLASIMSHDPSTARNYYFRPQFNQVASLANSKMSNLLLQPAACAAAAPAAAAPSIAN
ncbi:MAG: hypothetical protein P4L81_03415 [Candidatus Pacebacteria bacterium]|nr:hypothetical protein [Candidatus Paceibacterota bacterium]